MLTVVVTRLMKKYLNRSLTIKKNCLIFVKQKFFELNIFDVVRIELLRILVRIQYLPQRGRLDKWLVDGLINCY
jgi:hypothetical protein